MTMRSELRAQCEDDYEDARRQRRESPVVGFKGFTITRSLKAAENKNIADATMARNLLCAALLGEEVLSHTDAVANLGNQLCSFASACWAFHGAAGECESNPRRTLTRPSSSHQRCRCCVKG